MFIINSVLFVLMFLYSLYFLLYCSDILKPRIPQIILIFVFPLITATIYFMQVYFKVIIPIMYISNFIMYFFIMRISFVGKTAYVYWASINVIFHTIAIRGLTIGVMSFFLNRNMSRIVEHEVWYPLSMCISLVILTVFLYIFRLKIDIPKIKILISNAGQLKFVYTTQTIMITFLIFCSYSYYYNLDLIWFTIFHLLTCVFILLGFYIVLSMATETAVWIDEELNHETIRTQLEKQINRYKEREDLLERIRQHNHDYKNTVNNLNGLLTIGKISEAQNILQEMGMEVNCIIEENKRYSNSIIVDVILQELAEECKKDNINFSAECFISDKVKLTDLQLCKIFNNLVSNSLEACRKQSKSDERYIEFKSLIKDNNMIISEKNSFNGIIVVVENELITTKKNRDYHGLGVKSIKAIVEGRGGFSRIQVNKERKEFAFLITLPLVSDKGVNN